MSGALRIAVVGCGIGVSHIEGFQEFPNLFDVKVICDLDLQRATAVAAKYRIHFRPPRKRREIFLLQDYLRFSLFISNRITRLCEDLNRNCFG